MTLWDACGNRLLVVVERAEDPALRDAHGIARRCFEGEERIADGIAWFAPRDDHHRLAFFNPDGSHERLCGNGLLIAAAALGARSKVQPFDHPAVDVSHTGDTIEARATVPLLRRETEAGPIFDTGSPHLVIERNDVADLDLETIARPLVEALDVNVTLYSSSNGVATVRTYERGVNAETLACGTGALAVAFTLERTIEVRYPGGAYRVSAERVANGISWLLSTSSDCVRRA